MSDLENWKMRGERALVLFNDKLINSNKRLLKSYGFRIAGIIYNLAF